MSNFELIDDYLSNRLTGADKEAFDKALQNDPTLRSDLDFQKQIVEGIRTARASELKSMLNKVPVGGTPVQVDFSVVKMAAGIIAAGVVGSALYFYVTRGELPPFDKAATDFNNTEKIDEQVPEKPDVTTVVPDSTKDEITPEAPKESNESNDSKELKKDQKQSKKADKQQEPVKQADRPKIEVTDPSSELENSETKKDEHSATLRRSDITPSRIAVDVDSSNKKFDFHYQFVGSKLMLFGSFDKSLYEILELNGDNHAVFLVYKDAYYLLDENQHKITRLEPITDAALVGKLKEYRK